MFATIKSDNYNNLKSKTYEKTFQFFFMKLISSKCMKIKLILLLVCICPLITVSAQVATFEEMKARLNDKSLPIVNLTVEIDKVSKPEYTSADIEIADPERRTDPENVCTTFRCKVKYRGASSLQYEKKSFNVKLLNDKGKSLDANLFGIRKDDA